MAALKVGIQVPHFGPQASAAGAVEIALHAERLGLDSVWVGDHIAYPEDQVPRFGPAFAEAVTTLAWVGARTARVTLGTAVLVLPYRHPLLLAKQLATLADLAGPRLVVGIGAGHLEAEFRALGADFAGRGGWTDEAVAVLRRLWQEPVAGFEGRLFRFDPVVSAPRPPRGPLPIWVGGASPRALRRAAELGDGWLPIWHRPTGRGYAPAALRDAAEALGERAARAGRPRPVIAGLMPLAIVDRADPEPFPLIGPAALLTEQLGRYREAGLEHLVLNPYYGMPSELMPRDLAHCRELLSRFVEDVLPRSR
jgi:probable F420-dependent oxidoreductase